MSPNRMKERIDTGFTVVGTAPAREVLYDLMEKIFQSKTGQRLYDLLESNKKITIGFCNKTKFGEVLKYPGEYSLISNKISIDINRVRSPEDRISTLTHELFHALQYKTGTLHRGFAPHDGKRAFILNELEAQFKCMEIINELYPNANYVSMDLIYPTKIDCIVYRALQQYAQKALISAGQKSSEIAKKIARRVAKFEIIQSKLFSITPFVAEVLGENWANEFDALNQGWKGTYHFHSINDCDLTPIMRLLPLKRSPTYSEIKKIIANRFELPVDVFTHKKVADKLHKIIVPQQRQKQ